MAEARSSRRSRAAPKPEDPPRGLLREGNDLTAFSRSTVITLLEQKEGKKRQVGVPSRKDRASSYLQTLKSSNATELSIDGLSKTEIETKLTNCVKTWWENYDEALGKFRAQNVEAPAPAAVAPPPEDYGAVGQFDLKNLVTARKSRAWARTQTKNYEDSTSGMRELLQDQAADPSQWDLVAKHRAPAPKYDDRTVSVNASRGELDADTTEKWLRELKAGTAIDAFESPSKEASIAILLTLPTMKDAATAGKLREALA